MIARRKGGKALAALFVFVGFRPGLIAQQYCVGGAVTSENCSNCVFHFGDAVATKFSVKPGSITCSGSNARCCSRLERSGSI
jgi:hypothetical protein